MNRLEPTAVYAAGFGINPSLLADLPCNGALPLDASWPERIASAQVRSEQSTLLQPRFLARKPDLLGP